MIIVGERVFRYIGMHPGTRARPVMHEARDRAARAVELNLAFHLAEAIGHG